jgi:acid phosphatase type 7
MRSIAPVCRLIPLATLVFAGFLPAPISAQTVLVQPYLQPGDGRFLVGSDVRVVRWLTDQTPGDFLVEFQTPGGSLRSAKPTQIALDFPALKPLPKKEPEKPTKGSAEKKDAKKAKDAEDAEESKVPLPPEKDQHYLKYTALLEGLPFNSDVSYRVKLGNQVIREATFRTRATADKSVRCVLVGDLVQGRDAQKEIAYQIALQKPEFVVALGDLVYPTGRVNQYMHLFWGTYSHVADAGPRSGAPLMASVPFYPVIGNHDIGAKLARVPDALAIYHFFAPPKGGPGEGPWVTSLGTDKTAVERFRSQTADSYPNLDAYSFDYGPAHFVVFNDNKGLAIDQPQFLKWLTDDLKKSPARWKLVCFHVPGFHSSKKHYVEQQVRRLQPLFEECGVDLTFAGHVHNYQRSVPLKFAPGPKEATRSPRVNGEFKLDTTFDGIKQTQPAGIIHIVAGGGGASLYGPGLDKAAEQLQEDYGPNYADFTAKMVATEHSFVVLDVVPDRLQLTALGVKGNELDRVIIVKGK